MAVAADGESPRADDWGLEEEAEAPSRSSRLSSSKHSESENAALTDGPSSSSDAPEIYSSGVAKHVCSIRLSA